MQHMKHLIQTMNELMRRLRGFQRFLARFCETPIWNASVARIVNFAKKGQTAYTRQASCLHQHLKVVHLRHLRLRHHTKNLRVLILVLLDSRNGEIH
jgi:hypothetical protein